MGFTGACEYAQMRKMNAEAEMEGHSSALGGVHLRFSQATLRLVNIEQAAAARHTGGLAMFWVDANGKVVISVACRVAPDYQLSALASLELSAMLAAVLLRGLPFQPRPWPAHVGAIQFKGMSLRLAAVATDAPSDRDVAARLAVRIAKPLKLALENSREIGGAMAMAMRQSQLEASSAEEGEGEDDDVEDDKADTASLVVDWESNVRHAREAATELAINLRTLRPFVPAHLLAEFDADLNLSIESTPRSMEEKSRAVSAAILSRIRSGLEASPEEYEAMEENYRHRQIDVSLKRNPTDLEMKVLLWKIVVCDALTKKVKEAAAVEVDQALPPLEQKQQRAERAAKELAKRKASTLAATAWIKKRRELQELKQPRAARKAAKAVAKAARKVAEEADRAPLMARALAGLEQWRANATPGVAEEETAAAGAALTKAAVLLATLDGNVDSMSHVSLKALCGDRGIGGGDET